MEKGEIREALDQLDGTTESAVKLLTGLSSREIQELGGVPVWPEAFRTRREDCAKDRCPIDKFAGRCHLRRGHGGACDPMGESHLEAEAER